MAYENKVRVDSFSKKKGEFSRILFLASWKDDNEHNGHLKRRLIA